MRRQGMQDRIHKNVLLNFASDASKDNWCVIPDVCPSQTGKALDYGLSVNGSVTWYIKHAERATCWCNNNRWKIQGSEKLREPQTQKKVKMD